MGIAGSPFVRSQEFPDTPAHREALVRRVSASAVFEKSVRLRAFFLHVCRCALDSHPEAATEQQIGIHVYDRPPGYSPNEDNIVRSQARLLRMKLEHYFANDGRDEPVVITIPKGRYVPIFEFRSEAPKPPVVVAAARPKPRFLLPFLAVLAGSFGLVVLWLGYLLLESRPHTAQSAAFSLAAFPLDPKSDSKIVPHEAAGSRDPAPVPIAATAEFRIAAGHSGAAYTDSRGRRWEPDRFFAGGVPRPGPNHLFPPIADAGLFRSIREADSADVLSPEPGRNFSYAIPLRPGSYELRLYFADPRRNADATLPEDAQNTRRFQVSLNGSVALPDFDPIADAGSAAVDVRAFKDITAAADGKLHIEFRSQWTMPAFVSAIELTPGTHGKLRPIRISTHPADFEDAGHSHWSGDTYFIDGRTNSYRNSDSGPQVPPLYTTERFGNFQYAIPVPPGSYTVRLHFLEAFFSPLIEAANCHGAGCRVFDVTCNGVMLLPDFDIAQAASGAFHPVVRDFHGLRPNGQGKLLLAFSPKINYAEVRAIEVFDEAR